MTIQSLCHSYDHNQFAKNNKSVRTKFNNNYHNDLPTQKRGELVLAIAQFIIKHNSIDKKKISIEMGVCISAVEKAIKKIRGKLDLGHSLPGLSNAEEEILLKIMSQKKDSQRKEHKARWNVITGIMREHVVSRMFFGAAGVAEISKLVGLKRQDVKGIIERIKGCDMEDLAREMYRESKGIAEIARKLGMAQKDVKKALPKVIKAPKTFKPYVSEVRRISTIKPGSPKSQRKLKKRPASISRTGLAAWCMQHYDSNGELQLPNGWTAPGDLPKSYPRTKTEFTKAEPRQTFIPASAPHYIAECTNRGRRRIGYMNLS